MSNHMSKRKTKDGLLTVEEAASILGCGQQEVSDRMTDGKLTRKRATNGELRLNKTEVDALARQEYCERLVADWPMPTEEQRRKITYLLYGGPEYASTGPSEYEMAQYQKAREREDAIKAAKKLAESLTACDVCNLQPDVHHLRRAQGIDMHEWQPGRAEKIMTGGTK